MLDSIKEILLNEGIECVGAIDISECEIINERILPKDAKSVIMFCIPYRSTKEIANDGFSEYARIYDYHKFSATLFERIIPLMKEITGYEFYGFCDHSPINEKLAAAKCGLGIIGRNSLLINNVYGSFIFLGTILTNAPCEKKALKINFCENCGMCIDACPNSAIMPQGIDRSKCLSAISQKKTKSNLEKSLLKENHIVWGCDICQNVCPHNSCADISPIPYFENSRINNISIDFINSLSDDEFKKYAFSYKGRKIVLDNIEFN